MVFLSPLVSTSVTVYFPFAQWYDWYTHQVVSKGGEQKTLDTPMDHIQVCGYCVVISLLTMFCGITVLVIINYCRHAAIQIRPESQS